MLVLRQELEHREVTEREESGESKCRLASQNLASQGRSKLRKKLEGGILYSFFKVRETSAFSWDEGKEPVERGSCKIWEREELTSGPMSLRQGANNQSGI